jgi:hypothetical protein
MVNYPLPGRRPTNLGQAGREKTSYRGKTPGTTPTRINIYNATVSERKERKIENKNNQVDQQQIPYAALFEPVPKLSVRGIYTRRELN